jgi:hypothetical protein
MVLPLKISMKISSSRQGWCVVQLFTSSTSLDRHASLPVLLVYNAYVQHQHRTSKMSTDTTSHSMYDSDELTWTCECGQIFDLYEPEPSTTIRCQDWQTQSPAPAHERDYVEYLLVGAYRDQIVRDGKVGAVDCEEKNCIIEVVSRMGSKRSAIAFSVQQ